MWMVVGEFLFLVTKSLKSRRLDLLSHHEIWFQNISFSSRNWRKLQISWFVLPKFSFSSWTRKQISTFLFSLLEFGDMNCIFLFLFSISLFGFSSMPAFWLFGAILDDTGLILSTVTLAPSSLRCLGLKGQLNIYMICMVGSTIISNNSVNDAYI